MTELEDLFETMKTTSKQTFEKFGEHVPMFLAPEAGLVMPIPHRNMAEKRMLVSMVKAIFKEQRVTRYGFAFEAWMATIPLVHKASIDIGNVTLPSERPDRQECIMIITEEKGKPPITGMWLIKRNKKGRGKIGEFQLLDGAEEVGAFRNMLGTEILH